MLFRSIKVRVTYPSNFALSTARASGLPDPFVRIQAFRTKSFNGLPDASVRTGVGISEIMGLEDGESYYIRAYVEQDGDTVRDAWESWGYYRAGSAAANPFVPLAVKAMAPGNASAPVEVEIRDCDTDNDLLPDSYEYAKYGDFRFGLETLICSKLRGNTHHEVAVNN